MWPLLKRDGLALQYVAVTLLWNRLIGYNPFKLRPSTFVQQFSLVSPHLIIYTPHPHSKPTDDVCFYQIQAACSACVALHILELIVPAPARYPDLYAVLNVLISTPVFVLTWLWSMKRGLEARWALGGMGGGSHGHAKSTSLDLTKDLASSSSSSKAATAEGSSMEGASGVFRSASMGRESGYRTVSLGVGQAHQRVAMRSPTMR